MKQTSNPTTRCYPRTMDEAFPNDIDRAQWWYPPEKKWTVTEVLMLLAGLCIWAALAYYFSKD